LKATAAEIGETKVTIRSCDGKKFEHRVLRS